MEQREVFFVAGLKGNCTLKSISLILQTVFEELDYQSPTSKIKQEQSQTDGWKWQKYLGWRRRSQCDIIVVGRQAFEAAEWSWIQLGI